MKCPYAASIFSSFGVSCRPLRTSTCGGYLHGAFVQAHALPKEGVVYGVPHISDLSMVTHSHLWNQGGTPKFRSPYIRFVCVELGTITARLLPFKPAHQYFLSRNCELALKRMQIAHDRPPCGSAIAGLLFKIGLESIRYRDPRSSVE